MRIRTAGIALGVVVLLTGGPAPAPVRATTAAAQAWAPVPTASPAALPKVGPATDGSELTLTNVASGAGLVVATGSDGRIITSSDDGRTWRTPDSGVEANLRGIDYGGGHWLAVGDLGVATVSSDGSHWIPVDPGPAAPAPAFRAVAYSGGTWYVGGTDGVIRTAADPTTTWGPAAGLTAPGIPFWGAASRGGRVVISGDDSTLLTTTDGSTWAISNAPFPVEPLRGVRPFLWQVTRGTSGWIAAGAGGVVAHSDDGMTWDTTPASLRFTLRGAAFGKGRYVVVGEDGRIATSTDGVRWRRVGTVPTDENLRGVTFTGSAFVAVGDWGTILRSTDGVHWQRILDGASQSLSAIAYGNGVFVAVGAKGLVLRSDDGIGWAQTPMARRPTALHLYDVAFGGGWFVAVGARGTMLRSTDGADWRVLDSTTVVSLRAVAALNGGWIAGGDAGVTVESADGHTWSRGESLSPFSVRAFTTDGTTDLLAGAGIIASRTGGGSWALNPAGDFSFKTGAANAGGTFAVSGHAGRLNVSTDAGATWTLALTGSQHNLNTVAQGPDGWVTAGWQVMATSPDALDWTLVTSPTDGAVRDIVYAEGRWVAVGDHGALVSSPTLWH